MHKSLTISAGFALALATALAACSGSRGTAPLAPIANPATGVAGPLSSTFAYDTAPLVGATLIGRPSLADFTIDVALKMQDPQGLRTYAQAVSDPSNAAYRHYLTPEQIADRFGASKASQDAAVAYFKGFGMRVGGWSQRMMLKVTGSQSALERAFSTQFGIYRSTTGEQFVAPMTPPRVPVSVPVVGSTNIVHDVSKYSSVRVQASSLGILSGYAPQQIAVAFDYAGAYAAGYTGSGITIGIIGTGPISTPAPGHVGDLEAFKKTFNITGSSAITVIAATDNDLAGNAATGFTTPPPVTGSSKTCNNGSPSSGGGYPGIPPAYSPTSTCNPEDGETQIDTQQTATLARDATIDYFLAYNPNDGCNSASGKGIYGSPCPTTAPSPPASGATPQPSPGANGGPGYPLQGLAESDEELQSAIHTNSADILSLSYGISEQGGVSSPGGSPPGEFDTNGLGLEPTEFAALAAEGIATFVSSGDSGANECNATGPSSAYNKLCSSYPATDPNAFAVGGVTAALDGAGNILAPLEAWGIATSTGFSGSGGGTSLYFAQPSWQTGQPGIVGTTRNVPDASLVGDPKTGVAFVTDADPSLGGTSIGAVGGTSVSAPEMAAMWALVLQACKATASCSTGPSAKPYRLGNAAPYFYAIYANKGKLPYANVFYDVTYGSNASLPICVTNPSATGCPSPAPTTPASLAPGFNAAPGYDLTTGLGAPFARNLIRAVVGV
jgi:subtilase family serine protease